MYNVLRKEILQELQNFIPGTGWYVAFQHWMCHLKSRWALQFNIKQGTVMVLRSLIDIVGSVAGKC